MMGLSVEDFGDGMDFTRKSIATVAILGFLLMAGGGVCRAQEEREVNEAGQQVFGMDEMVVTATKTEREVKDVSTNVTVVTRRDIEQVQATDLMDLLRQVPGLVLNGQGSSKASFYASSRGLQPSTRGLLVMMDGIEMNDPSNYINVLNTPLNDIERIEVIKTPSSVLYGPAAVGGVINVITRKPVREVDAQASVVYGSFDRIEPTVNIAGRLDSGFRYGLNYWFLDTDGYRDNSFTRHHVVTPRLGYSQGPVDFEIFTNLRDAEYGFPGGLPLETFKEDPEKALQRNTDGDSFATTTGARLNWMLTESSALKLKSSYRTNDWSTEDFGFYFEGNNYWTWTMEADYEHHVPIMGVENTFLVGMEYRNLHNEPQMSFDDNHGGALLSRAEITEKILGFFIQDEIRPIDPLMINLGLRYDVIWTDFEDKLNDAMSFDNSHKKLSPRLGISYTFFPELNVFGNYSQGIRTVNLARSPFQLRENIDPEREESFELGLRGNLFQRVDYSVAGFHNITRDKIIQFDRYVYENAGEAQSTGVEVGVQVSLPFGLYTGLDYTYVNAEFTDFETSTASYDDSDVPLVPQHIFGANLGWRSARLGHINGSVRYVGSKYVDRDYANSFDKLDHYWVADLKYTYAFRDLFCRKNSLELTFAVNNLFDETYAEYGDINGGLYVPVAAAWPADGRAFFGGLSFKF